MKTDRIDAPRLVALQGRVGKQDAMEDASLWMIGKKILDCTGTLKVNLSLLFRQLKQLDEVLSWYGEEVEALGVATGYEEPVNALTGYKGIKSLFALTMIIEIGDLKRFVHPRQQVSSAAMDIRGYGSGGKSHAEDGSGVRDSLESNQTILGVHMLGRHVEIARARAWLPVRDVTFRD